MFSNLPKLEWSPTTQSVAKNALLGLGCWIAYDILRGFYLHSFYTVDGLEDATVLVTGASAGIGHETVKLLASRVGKIIVVARNVRKLEALRDSLSEERATIVVKGIDFADTKKAYALLQEVIAEHGPVRVVVNSAGNGVWRNLWEEDGLGRGSEVDPASFFHAPTFAAALTTAAVTPGITDFAKRTRSSRFFGADAHIINVQSLAAFCPVPNATLYNTSRFAFRGLSRCNRLDFAALTVKDEKGESVHPRVQVTEAVFAEILDSDYFTSNPGSRRRVPMIASIFAGKLTSRDAASSIVGSLTSGRPRIWGPWMATTTSYLAWLAPALSDILVLF